MATVTIENHDGRYRLRWLYQGKRFTMSCGVPATPTGKAFSKKLAAQIELDLNAGYFDPTLLKYKPRTLGKNATEVSCPELFKKFTASQFKQKGLAPGSMRRYVCVQAHVQKRLNVSAVSVGDHAASNFAASLQEAVSNRTAREYLWLLQNCWQWARGRYHIDDENPWTAQIQRIKPNPQQRVKPFTTAEIQAILGAFRNSPHYRHYADFVYFLFGVGCRFGEAAGLQWGHVADDYQTCWIGESVSRGHRKGTKTGKARTLLLSPTVSRMLGDRRAKCLKANPDDLVFPSPKGLPIDDHNFRGRAWKAILEQCHIEYRKPYAVRHSTISHALANGADPIALAEQTGHDKRVLLDTYVHAISKQSLFVEF